MKRYKLLLIIFSLLTLKGMTQETAEQKKQNQYNQLKNGIDSRHYRFQANSATTMKGRTIQLTSDYHLSIHGDTLKTDLPYYGRAYTSSYASTDQSLQFTTTQFSYKADSTKKEGWEITISPKNQSKANQIFLSVTASGYCTVRITSNDRDAISYYGTLTTFKNP